MLQLTVLPPTALDVAALHGMIFLRSHKMTRNKKSVWLCEPLCRPTIAVLSVISLAKPSVSSIKETETCIVVPSSSPRSKDNPRCKPQPTRLSRTFLQQPIFPQLVSKFPPFMDPRKFITVFTTVCHWCLSPTRLIKPTPSYPISLRSVLILSFHWHLNLQNLRFRSFD